MRYAFPMSPRSDRTAEPIVDRARLDVIRVLLVWRARALPFFSLAALIFSALDPRPWRIATLSIAALVLALTSLIELRALERGRPLTSRRIAWSLVVSGLSQLVLVTGSGGLASPIAPGVPLVAVIFNLSGPRRFAVAFTLCVQIPAMWLLALAHVGGVLPGLIPFDGLATVTTSSSGAVLAASAYTVFFVLTVTLGQWLRTTLDAAVEERVAEQRRLLALHEETARSLSNLSAEIAHELKNPLASIKGLAGLLTRELEGRPRERLAVMREEIDRMQAILDEFLHFSRPLVPLELRDVELGALLGQVALLHEGMALASDVRLEVEAGEAIARVDPRKIHQILVNLVQNALEASPRGASVRLAVSADRERVWIDVEDRGGGIDPRIRGSLFQAGATTKAQGSGIGLAIARGLARQHAGELTLEEREDGGVRARLTLPVAGPPIERVEASKSAGGEPLARVARTPERLAALAAPGEPS